MLLDPGRGRRRWIQIVDWVDGQPAITVLEVDADRSPSGSEDPPPGALPTAASAVVRIDRTSAADRLLADLVAVPAVGAVTLGTADQAPAALREQGQPDDVEKGRTLGRVSVPVEGADESVVYEIWEPTAGPICHGRRPGATSEWPSTGGTPLPAHAPAACP